MVTYTTFPAPGGAPLQPQEFYVQTYVVIPAQPVDQTKIFRAPLFARLPDPLRKAIDPSIGPPAPLYTPNPAQPFIQSDWLRQPSLPKAIGEVIGTLSPLLTPNPSAPFSRISQFDWPRPRDPQSKAQPTDQQNLFSSTLAPVAPVVTPAFRSPLFARLPDPRPKSKVDDPFNLTIYLPTTVVTFTISLLDKFDWPLPARARPALADTSAAAPAPLYTPNPPIPFNQDLWEGAAKAWPKSIGEAIGTLSPVLTPNPAQPFVQSAWDLATRGFPKVVGEVVGTLSPLLTPNPAVPFNQYEWRFPARVPLSLKSDVYFGAFPLYSPNPPIPFNQDLWENAARTPPRAIGEPVGGVSSALTPNPAQPFVQSDWFQIRSTQKARVDEPFNLTIYLPVVTVTFTISLLDKFDWPNPSRIASKQIDTSAAPSSPLYFPNPARPFTQNIWDSATKGLPKAGGEVAGILSPLLTPNPALPFSQKVWDSATPPKPKAYAEPLAAISALYNPNPSRPFSQYSWDSATRAWPKSVGESAGGILALLAPNPANPFNQYDWTRIPATSKARVDDFVNLRPLYTVVVAQNPFYYRDEDARSFAIARALPPQKSDVYRGPNTLLSPNPARPFHQDLWDLPTPLPRLKSLGDALAPPNPILIPNPRRPFQQGDWPNASAGVTRTAKVDTFEISLPIFAPPPVPPPPSIGVGNLIGAYPKWRKL